MPIADSPGDFLTIDSGEMALCCFLEAWAWYGENKWQLRARALTWPKLRASRIDCERYDAWSEADRMGIESMVRWG